MSVKYQIILFIFCASLFAFIGYWFAEKEFKKEKIEWQTAERESIRKELIYKARKNYENYIRINGIDSMDYDRRAEWLMSNSAYE
jgi:uncharacterized protein YneF (UPF0154 family)